MDYEKQQKIVDYLFEKCIYKRGNSNKPASSFDDITKEVTNASLNWDYGLGQYTVRVSFMGNGRFFLMPIDRSQKEYWFKMLDGLMGVSNEIDPIGLFGMREATQLDTAKAIPNKVCDEKIIIHEIAYETDDNCSFCDYPITYCRCDDCE